ncbi:hypothetical protein P8452_16927 [Trifolium repens]|nr:hypothetical protein P8452_16927 [Trifolium repens]
MARREESPVQEEEEQFPIGRAQGAPSDDIGWHFAINVQGGDRNTIQCKLCFKVISGGITQLKEHLAHMPGEVKSCARVTKLIRENMMKLILDNKAKKNDSRKRKEEFVSRLRGDCSAHNEDLEEEEDIRQATHESMVSHKRWQDGQRFPGSGIGSSRGASSLGYQRRDLDQRMRNVDVDLERSKSMKQTKVNVGVLKNARQKLAKALSKLIIHERLPINLATSPWLHNLLREAAKLGPGYFLNPQFQYGVNHGRDVARETLDGTTKVISRLEPNIYIQIRANNQLLLFRDKQESFGTPQAQQAWRESDPAEWWLIYGSSTPELQRVAIEVELQKLVFAYYNMKLKNRSERRRSQEDIEKNFSPINLDYIFQEDPLSPWVEEIEGPLLDGTQNAEWLPVESDDDDIEEIVGDDVDDSNSGQAPSQSGEGGLSPPSDENSGGNGGGEQVHGVSEGSHNSFQEESYVRRDQNLLSRRMEEESCDGMTGGGSSRGRARRGKSKKHETTPLNDSSSSSGVQSYGDFGFVAPFEGNQGNFPSYYQNPSYMPLGYYPYMPNPNTPFYNDAPMNYNESSTNSSYDHQQIEPPRSSGLFDYVFGRGGNDNDEGDSGSYDPARRSTMW